MGEVVIEEPADAGTVTPEDEQVKVIGPLRIGIPLFNIYLNEADELSRRLGTELAEWALEFERHPVPESSVALAHSLAGSSATVGYGDLSALARALEHALMRSHASGHGRAGEPELFNEAADEIRRLLHQFAAGFLRPVAPELMERLAAHERWRAAERRGNWPNRVRRPSRPRLQLTSQAAEAFDDGDDHRCRRRPGRRAVPDLRGRGRGAAAPTADTAARMAGPARATRDAPSACMRTLHTFKGGARLAGAMRLGEMAHRLETAIERLAAGDAVAARRSNPCWRAPMPWRRLRSAAQAGARPPPRRGAPGALRRAGPARA